VILDEVPGTALARFGGGGRRGDTRRPYRPGPSERRFELEQLGVDEGNDLRVGHASLRRRRERQLERQLVDVDLTDGG
jgi:hypothetical protein